MNTNICLNDENKKDNKGFERNIIEKSIKDKVPAMVKCLTSGSDVLIKLKEKNTIKVQELSCRKI